LSLVVLVIASSRDIAARNIAKELIRTHEFTPIRGEDHLSQHENVLLKYVESDGIYTNVVKASSRIDCVIFASRHRSQSDERTLTVHWTGNCTSRADFGGTPKTLSYTDPPRLRAAILTLDELRENHKLNYAVSLEATHHGPTELDAPTMFVEVGSTDREWEDPLAVAAASEAIWKAATAPSKGIPAVGFGGGHYCNKQFAALRTGGYAFSHILSKYFFDEYDEQVVWMAFERTLGDHCHTAVLDWKGIRGQERRRLLDTLKQRNIDIVRV
jgi:D-aminoacyl-tRNA deacylase